MTETRDLRSMARQTAELALQLAALPADGFRSDVQVLTELEQLAALIMREASTVRSGAMQTAAETRGMWRVMQPTRP
jgi:hypothetical protein